MANLIARSPFEGLLPLAAGSVEATEIDAGVITSVAPFAGQTGAVSSALEKAIGCPLPAVGSFVEQGEVQIVWTGLDQWFVLSPDPVTVPGAAMTDQSDAWASVEVSGPDASAVLARLVPIDLRPSVFAVGHASRTTLGHMSCILMRTGHERFIAMVFRSMARSAVHDLERAMRAVAARAALSERD